MEITKEQIVTLFWETYKAERDYKKCESDATLNRWQTYLVSLNILGLKEKYFEYSNARKICDELGLKITD